MRELLDFGYEPATEISNIAATSDLRSPILLELLTLEVESSILMGTPRRQ